MISPWEASAIQAWIARGERYGEDRGVKVRVGKFVKLSVVPKGDRPPWQTKASTLNEALRAAREAGFA